MYEHHNPTLALPLLNTLLSSLNGWTDSSYGNDACASIAKGELQLFLPNSLDDDENTEEVSYFQLYNDESGDFEEFATVESVLSFLS